MKKQYFIFLVVTCLLAVSNVKAQDPIEDFLKKDPSREGVTSVMISQQMLQSIFRPEQTYVSFGGSDKTSNLKLIAPPVLNVPEAYSSVSISRGNIYNKLFVDFIKRLQSFKYEQFMEVNKEDNNILGYYLKKVNDSINEVVVLRQKVDQFSAIYIKGNINIDHVDRYLERIRQALRRMEAYNPAGSIHEPDLALNLPDPDELKNWLNSPTYKDISRRILEDRNTKFLKDYFNAHHTDTIRSYDVDSLKTKILKNRFNFQYIICDTIQYNNGKQ